MDAPINVLCGKIALSAKDSEEDEQLKRKIKKKSVSRSYFLFAFVFRKKLVVVQTQNLISL